MKINLFIFLLKKASKIMPLGFWIIRIKWRIKLLFGYKFEQVDG